MPTIADLPEVTFADALSSESPYAYAARMRAIAPLARLPFGVMGWRYRHIERAMSETTRQMETEL